MVLLRFSRKNTIRAPWSKEEERREDQMVSLSILCPLNQCLPVESTPLLSSYLNWMVIRIMLQTPRPRRGGPKGGDFKVPQVMAEP